MTTIEQFTIATKAVENLNLSVEGLALDPENETQVIVLAYDPVRSYDVAYSVFIVDVTSPDLDPINYHIDTHIDQAKLDFIRYL